MSILLLGLLGCNNNSEKNNAITEPIALNEGMWMLSFQLTADQKLPVGLEINKTENTYNITFINDTEQIKVANVTYENNRLKFDDPVFNSWYELEIVSLTKIKGFWFKDSEEYKIAVEGVFGKQNRFAKPENAPTSPLIDASGKWQVDFSPNNKDNHYPAIAVFNQDGEHLTGTFLTETGDYRFLEGNVYGDELLLSCFDGSHAFLFRATLVNDSLKGSFWSGSHWEEPWVAVKNENYELTHPDSLTYLNEGYDKLAFSFKNTNDELVSLADEKFKNKVVIVNIMGPWCPNCKDETAYLSKLYHNKKEEGLEVIALSFDRTDDIEIAKKNIAKLKKHFNADYEFLLAGKASKIEAGKALPMLNHIMSYPTTIFIDKKGNIRKIRTGFYGPGTGSYYTRYIEATNDFIDKLLKE